jgi:hypothetical protein
MFKSNVGQIVIAVLLIGLAVKTLITGEWLSFRHSLSGGYARYFAAFLIVLMVGYIGWLVFRIKQGHQD